MAGIVHVNKIALIDCIDPNSKFNGKYVRILGLNKLLEDTNNK